MAHYYVASADTASLKQQVQQLKAMQRQASERGKAARKKINNAGAVLLAAKAELQRAQGSIIDEPRRQSLQQELVRLEGGFGGPGRHYRDARGAEVRGAAAPVTAWAALGRLGSQSKQPGQLRGLRCERELSGAGSATC